MTPLSRLYVSLMALGMAAFLFQYQILPSHAANQTPGSTSSVLSASVQNTRPTPTNSSTPTQTIIPTVITKPDKPPTGNRMTTTNDIFVAINAYRESRGVKTIAKSASLCEVAKTRADFQRNLGRLDHSGFQEVIRGQSEFRGMGEILQTNSRPRDATYLVRTGWAGSPSHNDAMLNATFTHGCGGIAGQFVVFIFGKKE